MPKKKPLPVVLVDTREQLPWCFEDTVFTTKRVALTSGDYSLEGMAHNVSIERKSLDDFVGCCVGSRDRFMAEMERLKGYKHACVIVEATTADVIEHKYTGGVHPNSVIGTAISIWLTYGVPVYFIGDRHRAREFAERILLMIHKRAEEERKAILDKAIAIAMANPEAVVAGGESRKSGEVDDCGENTLDTLLFLSEHRRINDGE